MVFKYKVNYYDFCNNQPVICSGYMFGDSYSDVFNLLINTYGEIAIDRIFFEKVSEDDYYEISNSLDDDEEENIEVPVEYREEASAEDIYWSDMCEAWQDGTPF